MLNVTPMGKVPKLKSQITVEGQYEIPTMNNITFDESYDKSLIDSQEENQEGKRVECHNSNFTQNREDASATFVSFKSANPEFDCGSSINNPFQKKVFSKDREPKVS